MASHYSNYYTQQSGLTADLYHLTMAYGLWKREKSETPAVFHLFFRQAPFGNNFAILAGLDMVIDFLTEWHFSAAHIQYLGRLKGKSGDPLFPVAFLNYLQRLTFSGSLHAIPEGTAVFAHQPLLRVKAPLVQGILIESALLNMVNFSTLIATKANRIVRAAAGDPVLEFGLRRAQGLDGALTASRSAFIGGCVATSHVGAGFEYGIPVKGTHAHAWVMCFDTEMEAFEAYADALPDNCIFLVDTYNTTAGIDHAIAIGHKLRARGYDLHGIRLDSGDLVYLSKLARQKLNQAGFTDTIVVASDSLDESRIIELKQAGAAIDTWGIGTHLVTAKGEPALGGVYKLGAIQQPDSSWKAVIKHSDTPAKTSIPGQLDVRRYYDKQGSPVADMVLDESLYADHQWVDMSGEHLISLENHTYTKMQVPIFTNGKLVYSRPELAQIQQYARQQGDYFAERRYASGIQKRLFHKKQQMSKTT
ncbi:MAG: nicotinate phosphoribosyltransferase [Saprospiraceae bacterium]|nr:nicotinate phosphoribosyltransferase [Saprospiraceae bacterium]